MRFIGGIIGGVVGGLIGALVWGLIAYYTGYQVGYVAWGVGLLVGVGVAMGCRGETGSETGALAAIIALLAICGGKYFAVSMYMNSAASQYVSQIHVDDDRAQRHFAHQLAQEYEDSGRKLKWPEGKDAESAKTAEDFPKDVWKDVQERWKAMTPQEQVTYRSNLEAEMKAGFQAITANATSQGFKASFGGLTIVFFAFALITAFKVGSGMGGDDD